MKALYVFQRIFHYFAVWFFIIAGLLGAFSLFYLGLGLGSKADTNAMAAVGAMVYLLGLVALILIVLAIVSLAASHIFRMVGKMAAKKAERRECECCCCCEEEPQPEPVSDLDAQVEEVMKWKNLYVEGIITEREFIDKRNEILRLSR